MTDQKNHRMRLQKWLSQAGIASRREAEEWIKSARIKINGKTALLGSLVDPEVDQILLDQKPIASKRPPMVYWLLHKPDKYLTSRKGGEKKACIFDLPKIKKLGFLVFPVGRLDYRTEGLLLLTNDGELSHRLCHPSYKVPRSYQVLISGRLSKEQEIALKRGITLEDGPVKCDVLYAHGQNLGRSKGSWYFITVYEGRNRLVRRIFESFEHRVVRLIRYGFGELRLPQTLKPGDYLSLTPPQIKYLKKSVEMI